MKSLFRVGFFVLMILIWSMISTCSPALIPNTAGIPTYTTVPSKTAPAITPTPDQIKGDIELFFVDPIVDEECSAHFPYVIKKESAGTFLDGAGKLDCKIRDQACGEVCVMYNAEYSWDATLIGVLYPGSPSYPDGALEVTFAGPFSMKFWFTDVPPGAYNYAPADKPKVFSSNDQVPVFTNFLDGAVSESKVLNDQSGWKFILHIY